MAYGNRARTTTRRIRIRWIRVAGLLVVIAAIAVTLRSQLVASSSSTEVSPSDVVRSQQRGVLGEALPSTAWPADGQAAVQIGQSQIQAGPNQHEAAIASVAKVMTAYVVLRDHPLQADQNGPAITLTDADVADTDRRRRQRESVVPIVAGEQLTERQALHALLLPSANNIAAVLARWDAGSVVRFVARMNATARALGMTHTRYTDPSGYDAATESSAADQVRVVVRAMRLTVFASIVATPSATLPAAGTVHNTNTLLGYEGFVGVKTGSDVAAGGCFAFRSIRWIDGKQTAITGVVLGQPGRDRIAAGLAAAAAMVDRIAGQSTALSPQQPTLPPPIAPRGHRPDCAAHPRRNHEENTVAAGRRCPARRDRRGLWLQRTFRDRRMRYHTSTHAKAVKFAECMRNNGVSAFPDPNASGELTIDGVANGSSVDTSSALFEQALSACKDLEPPGFTGTKVTPQQRTARLEFAQCMRDNGVTDFPDPTPNGPLIDTNRIPSAATNGGMSILNATIPKCSRDAAAAGVKGSK